MTAEKQNSHPDTGQRRHNQLSLPQMINLCDQLRAHHKKFTEDRVSWEDACTFLANRCGFPVTRSNLGSACEGTGLKLNPKRTSPQRQTRGLVRQLYAAVCYLYERLGEPVPQELREAAEHAERDRTQKQAKK